ncbi:MAG: hypothetical protein AAGA60_04460 [Cyanobacteria bacterium P01_E01_bin.42]
MKLQQKSQFEQEFEQKFQELAAEWRKETEMLSLVSQMAAHPAYQKIIEIGKPVIPLLLKELETEPDYWFWALREITGENPIQPEQKGRLKQMAQAWVQWGKERGYQW